MFNITGGEVVIILLLALIILGPDKLPEFVRRAGRVYAEIKKVTTGFRTEFRDAVDEPLREMRETANMAKSWFDEGQAEAEIEDARAEIEEAEAETEAEEADGIEFEPAEEEDADDEPADEGDDPNFYDENGTLLDAAAISKMIAEDSAGGTSTG